MTTRINIEVRKVGGPWRNVLIQVRKQGHIVSIIAPHFGPGFSITAHTSEPEMFPGVWELPSNPQESTSGVKLIAVQLEVLSQYLQSVNGTKRRRRFQLMVDKPGVGFFEIEGIAVVRNSDVAAGEELMKLLHEEPVVLEIMLVPGIMRKSADRYALITPPAVGETEDVPVF